MTGDLIRVTNQTMKLVRSWIEDYIDLRDRSDEVVAMKLTEIGHAVEGIESHEGDTVFEIDFTTNRIDAMSHRGVARELSAALEIPMRELSGVDVEVHEQGSEFTIRVDTPEMCTRFAGYLIRGVEIKDSAPLVRKRLEAVGLRPINNVVDVTNYVMMALGHPLHAYDFDLVQERTLAARRGVGGEVVECLDDVTRQIDDETVVIYDGARPVGLGGVIGGANTEIGESTKNVLLECAHFVPGVIRRTARRLGLKTDASYRFERAVDPNDNVEAICRAADMVIDQAGGRKIELANVVGVVIEPATLSLRDERLALYSDGNVNRDFAMSCLSALGMGIVETSTGIDVQVPTWRTDISEEIDLIEEVLRFYGYNNIPSALPRVTSGDTRHETIAQTDDRVRTILVGTGATEAINYAFVHPDDNALCSEETPITVSNAITENTSSMRLSLIPGLLRSVHFNMSYGTRDGFLFEVGRTYHRTDSGVVERNRAAFVMYGRSTTHWGSEARDYDFFDAKGVVEELARLFHVAAECAAGDTSWLKPGHAALVRAAEAEVARLGLVARQVLDRIGIKGEVLAAEVDLDALVRHVADWTMEEVSRFPGIPMVLRLLHGHSLEYATIVDRIRELDVPHLQQIGIWDRFVPEDSEQIKTTLGMWYQAIDRSLTQDEVDDIHARISTEIAKLLPVTIVDH